MNKQEACAFLGVSERSLARYASQGKIQVTYNKGTRGNVAVYDDADLEKLKEELAAPQAIRLASEQAQIPANPANLATRPTASMTGFFEHLQARDEALITSLLHRPSVPVENKLTLNLAEAAQLSGLSRNYLREAIRDRKLKAKIIGRGWRVKKTDLESYIQKL
jgi:excisionase family DNA binding protein